MRVLFLLDSTAREYPQARHALETLALLMGYQAGFAAPGASLADNDVQVSVGAASAVGDVAAHIEVRGWPRWNPADLELAEFEGRPLPCPKSERPLSTSEGIFPAPWLRSVGFLLAREEETIDSRRDQWECYAGHYSWQYEAGLLDRPLVNLAAAELSRRIESWCARRGMTAAPLERWRTGARFAVVLSHDVDDISSVSLVEAARLLGRARSPLSYAARRSVAQMGRAMTRLGAVDDPYWRFDQWAREEESYGFRSTFFVFPPRPARPHEFDPLYRLEDAIRFEGRRQPFSEVLRALGRRGFEIGLHASYRSHRSAAQLASEKAQIERAVGLPVAGIRQHFLRFDLSTTWRAQAEAGFAYDSTLGYNEAIGFRAGIAAPYRAWDATRRAALPLLELPLTVMDGALFRTLRLNAEQAARRTIDQIDLVEKVGGLAVLLWHPNGADERQFPGWWSSYRDVLADLSRRSAWVTTGAEIAAWWREREKKILL